MLNSDNYNDLKDLVITDDTIDALITYINDTLDPDDVFTVESLCEFAENGWVKNTYDIDAIFDKADLDDWALSNGYVKKESEDV